MFCIGHRNGICCHSNRIFGAGDRQQVLTGYGLHNSGHCEGKCMKHAIQAIRIKTVMDQVHRNKAMQLFPNRETNGFGDPHLSHLKKMFGDMHDVTTQAKFSTDWFPVFFNYNEALCSGSIDTKNEITREPNVFVSVLTILALECVVNSALYDRVILVICYLHRVIVDLEAYLERFLQPMCEYWHERLFEGRKDANYAYSNLKKTLGLNLVGPFNAKGKTADVVFTVGMQRQTDDVDYSGVWSDPRLLQIHFTRARRRLYSFFHDMTGGIRYHARGNDSLTRKAIEAGVPVWKKLSGDTMEVRKRVQQSNLRRQLFYWELKKHSQAVWSEEYHCEFELAGSKEATMSNCHWFLKETLPFQKSGAYAKFLKRDLQDAMERREKQEYLGVGRWLDEPLLKAVQWYEDMTNNQEGKGWPWHSFHETNVSQKDMDSTNFWRQLLGRDRQCREHMINEIRWENQLHPFRTREQRRDESDCESDNETDRNALFGEWSRLMLHCATVSVDSAEQCVVCVPFVNIRNVDVRCIYGSRGQGVAQLSSVTWLARSLAEATDALFKYYGAFFFCLVWFENIVSVWVSYHSSFPCSSPLKQVRW